MEPAWSLRIDSIDGLYGTVPTAVVQTETGAFIVALQGDHLLVFAANGTLERREYGPHQGTFLFPLVMAKAANGHHLLLDIGPRPDRLLILDDSGRVSDSYEYRGARPNDVAVSADGRLILSAISGDPDHIGEPLLTATLDGRVLESFGSSGSGVRVIPGREAQLRRRVAPGRDNTVWVVGEAQLTVERWSLATAPPSLLNRRAYNRAWLRGATESQRPSPDWPPAPRIIDVLEDANGFVWVIGWVADTRWKEAFDAIPDGTGPGYRITDANTLYDTVVEVLEPKRLSVVARGRFPEMMLMFAAHGLLASYRRTGETSFVDVHRVRLVPTYPSGARRQ
jgi:hypothetical protein